MTNTEALAIIGEMVDWFRACLGRPDDQEVFERLRKLSSRWSAQPELEPVVTILIKAWLEYRPEGDLQRRALLEHLGGLGRMEEGREVEAGQAPRPLTPHMEALEQHSKRLFAAARLLLEETEDDGSGN